MKEKARVAANVAVGKPTDPDGTLWGGNLANDKTEGEMYRIYLTKTGLDRQCVGPAFLTKKAAQVRFVTSATTAGGLPALSSNKKGETHNAQTQTPWRDIQH